MTLKESKNNQKIIKLLSNFGFLTIGKTLGDIFTFILFVVLSRTFGQEGVGQYSFAMALTGFLAVFADFGLYNFSIKEMSRQIGPQPEYFGGLFYLRLILVATVFASLLLLVPFLPFIRETKVVIIIIGAYQVIYKLLEILTSVFVAREDMQFAATVEAALRLIIALAGIAVVLMGGSLVLTLAAFPLATIGMILVAFGTVARRYGSPCLKMSWNEMRQTLRDAAPYGIFVFLRQLSTRVDVVLLGFFLGAASTGVYNVAYRLVFFLMFLSYFAGLSLFPLASRLYSSSHNDLKTLYNISLNLIILIALPIASGLWLIAPDLVNLIFGMEFIRSTVILQILSWTVFLAFVKSVMGTFLTSCDRQVDRTRGQWKAAWINLLGNALLIPVIGIKGAAITLVVSETLIVILFAVKLEPIVGWPRIGSRLAMSGAATLSFCLPFVFFFHPPDKYRDTGLGAAVFRHIGLISRYQAKRNSHA